MARSNRDGQRKRRDSFPKRVPDLGYYIILTDTDETEKNYLNGLQRSLPKELQGRLVIRVIKTKTDKMVAACKEQLSYEPQYGMADTAAALFRLVDHTAFDQYAVPVLKEIGEEFQLLSI